MAATALALALACAPVGIALALPTVDVRGGAGMVQSAASSLPIMLDDPAGALALCCAVVGAGTFSLGTKLRQVSLHRG